MESSIGSFIKSNWNDPIPTAPAIDFPNPVDFYTQHEMNKVRIKNLEEDLVKSKIENKTHVETIRRMRIIVVLSGALLVAIG